MTLLFSERDDLELWGVWYENSRTYATPSVGELPDGHHENLAAGFDLNLLCK